MANVVKPASSSVFAVEIFFVQPREIAKRLRSARRNGQQKFISCGQCARRTALRNQWRLFEHHMGIGTTKSKGTSSGESCLRSARPRRRLRGKEKPRSRQRDVRIQFGIIEVGRNLFAIERKRRLDRTRDPCG